MQNQSGKMKIQIPQFAAGLHPPGSILHSRVELACSLSSDADSLVARFGNGVDDIISLCRALFRIQIILQHT